MKNNTREFPPPMDADKVETLEADAILNYLKSNKQGLSEAEAKERLIFYGLNTIQEKHKSNLLKFLSYFWRPIAWMIEIAAILSVVVHHTEDLIIILVRLCCIKELAACFTLVPFDISWD